MVGFSPTEDRIRIHKYLWRDNANAVTTLLEHIWFFLSATHQDYLRSERDVAVFRRVPTSASMSVKYVLKTKNLPAEDHCNTRTSCRG